MRRSIMPAQYTGAPVDEGTIRDILESATYAPTHKRTEPWRFVVFTGEGLKRLAEMQSACYKEVTERDGSFKEERYRGLQTKPMQSSCIIAVCMKRDESARLPEVEEIGAVFCAVENMYLTAAAQGVACYLSTGGITYFEEAKKLFGLAPADRLIGFFHLGIPKQWPDGPGRRQLDEVTQWIVN